MTQAELVDTLAAFINHAVEKMDLDREANMVCAAPELDEISDGLRVIPTTHGDLRVEFGDGQTFLLHISMEILPTRDFEQEYHDLQARFAEGQHNER